MLITGSVLLLLATFFNPGLGHALDPAQPVGEARAPWFFLWVQELLRWGDPLWLGVFVPFGMIALLALLPYLFDRGDEGGQWFPKDGRLAQALALGGVLIVSLLTLVGVLR
jgi:quinol-cytochrome oxidoreductase complex cytochrome b subunit